MNQVIYVPGEPMAIDYAQRNATGAIVAAGSGDTLARIRIVRPTAVVGTEDEFIEQQALALTTAPVPITAEEYERAGARGINWQSSSATEARACGESFVLEDAIVGNVTRIYARLGRRHWRFQGVATLPHQDIMRRVALSEVEYDRLD